mmetsp:Transcript_9280/g.26553  ORF Transcript_9280/g.26553 Transcript_9280/m.26553 type:complete len:95 (-) Transcript_9280:675-959(-)
MRRMSLSAAPARLRWTTAKNRNELLPLVGFPWPCWRSRMPTKKETMLEGRRQVLNVAVLAAVALAKAEPNLSAPEEQGAVQIGYDLELQLQQQL